MALVTIRNLSLSFGGPLVLDNISLDIEPGQRIALLGRNGEGKSSLMKIIQGTYAPDSGDLHVAPDTVISSMPQDVPRDLRGSVFDVVASALREEGELLARYHHLSLAVASGENTPGIMQELADVQQELDDCNGWEMHRRAENVIQHMGLAPEPDVTTLSGGMKRRVLLAAALVRNPDILMLDEPTNHLDIPAIDWLEEYLRDFSGTLIFVTHDRAFLRRLATRIIELDRGRLFDWECDYLTFLQRKEEFWQAEEKSRARFDKKLAQEEAWIRRGIKARRTRNEGRVKSLVKMREQRRQRRTRTGTVSMQLQEAERSGTMIVKAVDATFGYAKPAPPLINRLSTLITNGDKVGIVGPNGAGKTTLINLLLGDLEPDAGQVRQGERLEVCYFDQLRGQLALDKTVMENLAHGNDKVTVNGRPRHVISYLQDFLFTPDRAKSPVSQLSGGERARLLLAKLFLQPANVLVLDEPTNDLDIETLELLEELLYDFSGTVLMVSHDRAFLNDVVTSTLVFEVDGQIHEFAGGYDDWQQQRKALFSETEAPAPKKKTARAEPSVETARKPRRLRYKEMRELEALPEKIEQFEDEQASLHSELADPNLYKSNPNRVPAIKARLAELEHELERAYQRWQELESVHACGGRLS